MQFIFHLTEKPGSSYSMQYSFGNTNANIILRRETSSLIQEDSDQIRSDLLLSRVRLFATPWTEARQASLSFTVFQSLLKLMSIELVIHPTISSSVIPFFSSLQPFPTSGSFPMSQPFPSSGQSIGASASVSVLPMNVQG